MVKNNFEVDVKVKCIEADMAQAKFGEEVGTTGQYVKRFIKKRDSIVNKTFVQMLEILGYDIQITYAKHKEEWHNGEFEQTGRNKRLADGVAT